jgi:hypothetical protein
MRGPVVVGGDTVGRTDVIAEHATGHVGITVAVAVAVADTDAVTVDVAAGIVVVVAANVAAIHGGTTITRSSTRRHQGLSCLRKERIR